MLIHFLIAGGLLITLVNLRLNLKYLRKPARDSQIPENPPLVSILIPARNEEDNIANCVESLCKQEYPNFEILALDDSSSDNTAGIVQRIAAKDNHVRLILGAPLAKGWSGKNFACYQLAKEAKGSWLLFVDADTIHASYMLRGVLAQAMELKTSLLSGFPHQIANSLPLKIITPTWYLVLMGWLPLWLSQRSKTPKPSIAIGQFLLFSKEEYWRIGGHEAVKSKVLEDIWLGIEMNKHGGRHIAIDLSDVVSCRMYNSLGGAWHGLGRSVYAIAEISVAALVMLMIVAYLGYLLPFYSFYREFFIINGEGLLKVIIFFQGAAILLMRWLSDRHFKNRSIISVILHPVGFLFLFMVVIYAIIRRLAGTGISWKERLYADKPTVQEEAIEANPD
ncbi:MAG: glycosyltransferase family 2 protein [Dehalococcoidales bacterium]|nr:glycosyltransferase family 2 protein [Dehalococcoidales bacterium]